MLITSESSGCVVLATGVRCIKRYMTVEEAKGVPSNHGRIFCLYLPALEKVVMLFIFIYWITF